MNVKPGYRFLLAAPLLVLGALAAVSGTVTAGPPPSCQLDVPSIQCVSSTPTSITIRVCAGPSGAPGGVSIHWKKASDYAIDGWAATNSYCGLSLSGTCPTSRFDLGPNECQDVTIHASTVIDEDGAGNCGASSPCVSDLACDTEYVFRIFAHNQAGPGGCDGTNPNDSPNFTCSTAPCPDGDCTFTWGYWKTHGPAGCNPSGQDNLWDLSSFGIGCLTLSQDAACAILQEPPKACAKGSDPNNGANAVLILQHQLIAAMLNVANGAVVCDFANQAIVDANNLLCGNEYACVGTSTPLGQQMIAVKDALAAYNDDQCSCPVLISRPEAELGAASSGKPSSWGKVKTIYR